MPLDDTEILHADAAPRTCRGDPRDCRWEQERTEVTRSLRRIEGGLAEIRERLAKGDGQLDQVKTFPERLVRLEECVSTLRLLCYSAVGTTLIAVLGAVLALVLRKG